MTVSEFLARFNHPKPSGGQWLVKCPSHDDLKASLAIREGVGGKIVLFCHAGCDRTGILGAMGLTDKDLFTESGKITKREVAAYDYKDERGEVLYQAVRFDPKDFRQRRPDGMGGYVWNLAAVRRVPYRLDELQGKEAVAIVEGEKDADALWAIGIPATCNVGGAGKWKDEYSRLLIEAGMKRARILPDNDAPGRDHVEQVRSSCMATGMATGLDVQIVPLPGVPEKGDVSDYLAVHTKDDLVALLKNPPPYRAERSQSSKADSDTVVVRLAGRVGTTPAPADTDSRDDEDEDEVELLPLTDAAWPLPLRRAAYVGIFGAIVDALAPQTEADPAALLLQLLAKFGNVIGRTAYFSVEADTHYLVLYVVLVGKTSKGRKGVSEGQARRFFAPIDPAWATDCQASGLSTGEGLIAAIRDPVEKQQPIRDNKRIVGYETIIEDHGVSDKRLYVNESEFASTLKVMQREGNTLSPVVRNAWDGRTLRTLTKASPLKATGPHVTIIGSITQHEVRRYLDATESANGFGNRFLWPCVQRSQYLPDGGAFVPVDGLIERLRELIALARDVGEMRRDYDANTLWHQVYRELSTERPGLLGSLTARAEPQVMRLACLYALGDGSPMVRPSHLKAALEVWRYCFDSAGYIFGDSLGDRQADTLLAALKAAGPTGLTRRDVNNDVFQRHLSATELNRIFALVRDARLAICRLENSRGGRPAQRWFYAREISELSEQSPVAGAGAGTLSALFAGSLARSNESAALGMVADKLFPDRPTVSDGPLSSVPPIGEDFDL